MDRTQVETDGEDERFKKGIYSIRETETNKQERKDREMNRTEVEAGGEGGLKREIQVVFLTAINKYLSDRQKGRGRFKKVDIVRQYS